MTHVTAYLARGWSVVPLHHVDDAGRCSCRLGDNCPPKNRGKHPIYKGWQNLTLSMEALTAARPRNIGIATGRPSGFWALDIDSPDALRALLDEYGALPPPFQRTGSGGFHVLFAMPADFEPTNSPGRLPGGIDVRGTGGQIVVPPSVSGRGPYELLDPAMTVHPNVPWLLELVRPPAYSPRPATAPVDTAAGGPDFLRASAYAQSAIAGLCRDLATEQHTRNARAFSVACRMHELINAGWTSYDYAESRYLEAAAQADGNKLESFSEREARDVWANAAQRVGDQAAELPPSALAGERLDFMSPVTLSTSSPASPGTLSSPSASSDLDSLLSGPISLAMSVTPATTAPELNLPVEFWEARPVLKHVRAAAHARLVSADVVFHSLLVRLAALWPHTVRLDTGITTPASANLFSAIVGPSGSGKSSGIGVARGLLPLPYWLDRNSFADDLPLGTGEGMAEAFMGMVAKPKLDDLGVPVQDRDGATKTVNVRAQVRHNALFHADEGESLAKMLERQGAMIGVELRRAWTGGTIGQANGRAETTRIIPEGSFSLGFLIGFQLNTVQELFKSSEAGTPQRFLYAWALDQSAPEEYVPDPGPLPQVWPQQPPDRPAEGFTPWFTDPGGQVDERPVRYAASILAELRAEKLDRLKDRLRVDELDSHRPVTLVKISALLAYLDGGRRDVTEEDWALAQIVWRTSCAVRDHAVDAGRRAAGKAAESRVQAHSAQETAADMAKLDARDRREQAAVERVALQLSRRVQGESAPVTHGWLHERVAYRDRGRAEEALTLALERAWVQRDDAGLLSPGHVRL